MDLQNLESRIKILNDFINKSHLNRTETERKLLKASKLPEEVGEFYNELLISLNFTREWKDGDSSWLEKELADVIITSLVIARDLEIDIFPVINAKLQKVFTRYNLWK